MSKKSNIKNEQVTELSNAELTAELRALRKRVKRQDAHIKVFLAAYYVGISLVVLYLLVAFISAAAQSVTVQ